VLSSQQTNGRHIFNKDNCYKADRDKRELDSFVSW